MLLLLALPLAAAQVGDRCHTPSLLALRAVEGPAPALAAPSPYRPEAVGFVDSEIYPIRVHYRRSQDAHRASAVILPMAEESWRAEVVEMGWPPPPSDGTLGGDERYDYYLTNEDTYGGAYTWGTGGDRDPTDDWYSLASFIAIDDLAISDADMPDFVSHEFNHALQYTIDGWELTGFVWESTAEAMEELVYPETDLYMLDIPDFQELPFCSLLHDGYSDAVMEYDDYSYYEYGGSIVGLFLEQRYGSYDGTTLRRLWELLAQGTESNEPDYVDALSQIGGAEAPTLGDLYLELAEWRVFVAGWDDGAHFHESGDWGRNAKVTVQDTLDVAGLDGETLTPEDPPYDLGTTYYELTVPAGEERTLSVTASTSSDTRIGLVLAGLVTDGPSTVVREAGDGEGASVSAELPLGGLDTVVLGVAALGPDDLDAEGRHPRREVSLAFTLGDGGGQDSAGEDDTNGPVADDDGGKGGCGCVSAPAAMPGAAALLLAALGLGRRRTGGAPAGRPGPGAAPPRPRG